MSSETASIELTDDAIHAAAMNDPGRQATSTAARVWNWIDSRLEHLSDYLNPILVKETRQALKSRQFISWFLLLLAACWIVTIGGIALIGPSVHYAASGGVLFLAYYFVLTLTLVIVVPFAAFRSLAAEQEDNTRDVLMVSALSPYQILNGKLGSAALQMVVYLSALSPCLAFTYLLRGIDLLTILVLPAMAVLVSIGLSMLALLMASVSRKRYSQVLSSVGLIALLFGSFFCCFSLAVGMITDGYYLVQDPWYWAAAAAVLNGYVCLFLLAYFAAAALNSFTSANRSTALRRTLFFCQVCYVGWTAGFWISEDYDVDILLGATIAAGCFWCVAGAMLTGEPTILSERVRRGLPATSIGRLVGTLFNPGPGTGFLFVLANLVSLGVLFVAGLAFSNTGRGELLGGTLLFGLGFAYIVGLLGLGRLIVAGLRRIAQLTLLGCLLIDFLLVLCAIGLPEIFRASVTRYGRESFAWFDLTNPVRTFDAVADAVVSGNISPAEGIMLLTVVPGLAFCLFLINLTLAAREIRQTRAPLPQRIIEDDADLAPEQQAVANPWGDLRQD